jgi:hypothetical protein
MELYQVFYYIFLDFLIVFFLQFLFTKLTGGGAMGSGPAATGTQMKAGGPGIHGPGKGKGGGGGGSGGWSTTAGGGGGGGGRGGGGMAGTGFKQKNFKILNFKKY